MRSGPLQSGTGECIACQTTALRTFLDLGQLPLANRFLTAAELDEDEPRYPLRAAFCEECGHVQLVEHAPPVAMFDDYSYMSGVSDTLRSHFVELAAVVVERFDVCAGKLVVDVGSNDGSLLSAFQRHGVRTLGVDPARNLAEVAQRRGVETVTTLFNPIAAREMAHRHGRAAIITATNTFPHIQDLVGFIEAVDALLATDGALVLEMHYLADMLEQRAFDTVYHEHVSYWALGPIVRLFGRHGLTVTDAERLPFHHGQLRVMVQRSDRINSARVEAILAEERAAGLDRFATYEAFERGTKRLVENLRSTLRQLSANGATLAGYGAPAKASILLNVAGIGPQTIDYIADRSPLKQGRFTPGTHIPVVSPDRLLQDQPDYVVLFAWNIADEVVAQQADYLRRGGRFIVPIPAPTIIDSNGTRATACL